ncbi:hypothetical protein [Cohnella silvisoli]|uniref:Uncharacterized protein n=1 Tax=Cohnella silvisoli TaxID=2873699 RepID=A0ABV1L2C4_9BACL|nr:hypothetical protein [Cohnella silvisoli]MCD9025753.1 hypothetical protein [Cohnella silvisoli]
MNPERRKAHIRWTIAQNPVTITIHRTGKQRAGGGFQNVKTDLGPFIVRIFVDGSQTITESETIGTRQISKVYSLLADSGTDIQASPDIDDQFTVADYGTFVVKGVTPQIVKGIVCGYQVDLERVS